MYQTRNEECRMMNEEFFNHEVHEEHEGFFNREGRTPHAGGLEREGFWEDENPLRATGEAGSVSRGFVLRCERV